MDPLTLLLAGGAAALALRKRQALPAAASPATTLAPVPAPTGGLALPGNIPDVSGVGDTVKDVTGVDPGKIAKVVGSVVAAAGAALGADAFAQWFDKLFGGSGGGATGIVLRAGLDTWAAGTVLGVCFFWGSIGAVVSWSGIGLVVVAVAWLIASAIDDLNRLAFGQAGALREFAGETDRVSAQLTILLQSRANDVAVKAGTPAPRIEAVLRCVRPMADGYMQGWNWLRYETWMARPMGIGVDRAYHAKWGLDRGYFVGPINPDTGDLIGPPGGFRSWSQGYQDVIDALPETQEVALNDGTKVTVTLKEMTTVQVLKTTSEMVPVTHQEAYQQLVTNQIQTQHIVTKGGVTQQQASAQPIYQTAYRTVIDGYVEKVTTAYVPVQRWQDKQLMNLVIAGLIFANISAYVKWMGEEWGLGVNAEGHCKAGLTEVRFVGTAEPGTGALLYTWGASEPIRLYWKDLIGQA